MPIKTANVKKLSPQEKLGDLTYKINYGIMKVETFLPTGARMPERPLDAIKIICYNIKKKNPPPRKADRRLEFYKKI